MINNTAFNKTTEDLLANYTNVEIQDGVYVNNSLLKMFDDLKIPLALESVRFENGKNNAIYKYPITNDLDVRIYTNAKHEYIELVHFHKLTKIEKQIISFDFLNLANRHMIGAKVLTLNENIETVEVSLTFAGDFSVKSFVRFLQNFHNDVLNYYKVLEVYMTNFEKANSEMLNDVNILKDVLKVLDKKSVVKVSKKKAAKAKVTKARVTKTKAVKTSKATKTKVSKTKASKTITKKTSKKYAK